VVRAVRGATGSGEKRGMRLVAVLGRRERCRCSEGVPSTVARRHATVVHAIRVLMVGRWMWMCAGMYD